MKVVVHSPAMVNLNPNPEDIEEQDPLAEPAPEVDPDDPLGIFAEDPPEAAADAEGDDTDPGTLGDDAAPPVDGEGEGEGEDADKPPDTIDPTNWDGSFPEGPAPVNGEGVPYLTWLHMNAHDADGIGQIPPEQLSVAIEALTDYRLTQQREALIKEFNEHIQGRDDAMIVADGDRRLQEDVAEYQTWARENPDDFNRYIVAKSRLDEARANQGRGGGGGQPQRRAAAIGTAVDPEEERAVLARLSQLPEAGSARIRTLMAQGFYPRTREGLSRMQRDVDRAMLGSSPPRRRSGAQNRRRGRAPAAAGARRGGNGPSPQGDDFDGPLGRYLDGEEVADW